MVKQNKNPGINNSVLVADVKKLAVPSLNNITLTTPISITHSGTCLKQNQQNDYPWAIGQKTKALCYEISWNPVEPFYYK